MGMSPLYLLKDVREPTYSRRENRTKVQYLVDQ